MPSAKYSNIRIAKVTNNVRNIMVKVIFFGSL